MKAMIFGLVSSIVMVSGVALADANIKMPMHPLNTGVVCNEGGIDALALTHSDTASVKIAAYGKEKVLTTSSVKNGNIVSFIANGATTGEGKLEVNFDRALPGGDSFQGELDVELDGERIHVDIPCRLLFMGKQPSIKAWQ